MNEKTRNFIEEMKKQTIGVEIEMANITRERACRVIAKYFGTEHTVKHDGGGYDTWSCKDNQGRRWNITRDGSIISRTDLEKAELGTPILTYDDIEDLQEIARELRHAGAISNPLHGCGVHCPEPASQSTQICSTGWLEAGIDCIRNVAPYTHH